MEPGTEMDFWIAQKVMGEEHSCDNCGELGKCGCLIVGIGSGVPHYSTTWEGAGKVVEKLNGRFDLNKNSSQEWSCTVWTEGFKRKGEVYGIDTAPHAICTAALISVGVKI